MLVKKCIKCGKELPITKEYFPVRKDSMDGLRNDCRICHTGVRHKYYESNKDKMLKQNKENYEKNKDIILERNKIYQQNNKEYIAKIAKEYRENNKEKIKEYRELNKERKHETNKFLPVICEGELYIKLLKNEYIPTLQFPIAIKEKNEQFEREYLGEWGKYNDKI